MTNINALTARRAIEIAHEYGFRAHDIRTDLIEARKMHGYVSTGTDGVTRIYTAEYLFRGWMADYAYEARCESRAARDFVDQAYGRDY